MSFPLKRKHAWLTVLALGAAPGALQAQGSILNQFSPLSANKAGIHLYGVSVFSAYYTNGTPFGINLPFAAPLASEGYYGGVSTSIGWGKSGSKSSASIVYSPSYVRAFRTSDFSTFNQGLSVNFTVRPVAKWTVGFSASGMVGNLEQSLFGPTRLSSAASIHSTFDELAAAILTGGSDNFALSSALAGAQTMSSPEQAFYYGNRMLSASAVATVSYAPSQRSSIHFGAHATRAQRVKRSDASAEAAAAYLIPHTTSAGANLGWSYSLTPRTQFGADVTASRMESRFQQAFTTRATLSIGRTMSPRWFVQGALGAGKLIHVRLASAGPRGVDYVASGSLGHKVIAHTFLATASRTLGDAYGIGGNSTVAVTGSWAWRQPGSPWAVHASVGHQRLQGFMQSRSGSWMAAVGLARSLGAQMLVSAQYGYYQFPAYAIVSRGDLSQQGVSVSLTWTPSGHR